MIETRFSVLIAETKVLIFFGRNLEHCVRRHSFEKQKHEKKKLRITVNHERSGLEMMFTVF